MGSMCKGLMQHKTVQVGRHRQHVTICACKGGGGGGGTQTYFAVQLNSTIAALQRAVLEEAGQYL